MVAQDRLIRLQQFLSFDPENATLWIDAVSLAIEIQAWPIAQQLVDEVVPGLRSNADVNALIGQVLLVHQQYDAAAGHLEQAIAQGIQQPAVWINLGYCHFYREQFAEARAVLDGNSQLKDIFPQAFYVLSARLAYHLDDSELAIEQLKVLHETGKTTAESAGLLSLLLFEADREYDLAMQMANLALAKNPHAIEALIARASLQLDARDYEAAHLDSQLAVTYHPESGRAWASLAQVQFNNLQFDLARDSAELAVKHMADHIGTWHLLGWSCLMLGDYEKALWSFQQSYEIDRRFGETHGGLASVYAHMGEERLANNHIKVAEKLDKDGFAITYARMVLLNRNSDGDKAQEFLNRAITTMNNKVGTTPQELIAKRMQELMQRNSSKKTLH